MPVFVPFLTHRAMDVADKAALASQRVSNIIETMTFNVYRYISRCAAVPAVMRVVAVRPKYAVSLPAKPLPCMRNLPNLALV